MISSVWSVDWSLPINISNFSEYCKAIIYSVLDKLTISQNNSVFSDNICNITIEGDEFEFFSFKKLEFCMNDKLANNYYDQGYKQFSLFIEEKKRKNSLLIEKSLIENIY